MVDALDLPLVASHYWCTHSGKPNEDGQLHELVRMIESLRQSVVRLAQAAAPRGGLPRRPLGCPTTGVTTSSAPPSILLPGRSPCGHIAIGVRPLLQPNGIAACSV